MADAPDFQIVELDHIVLRVKDVERAMAFYTETLGLAPHRFEEFRSGEVPFPCARINDHTLIDLQPLTEHEPVGDGPRNLDHFCMAVKGVDMVEFEKYLIAEGVTVNTERAGRRSGARGMADSIYIQDPEGNCIELRAD